MSALNSNNTFDGLDEPVRPVGISLRLQGKLGFPYNVKQLMVKYVLLC